MDNDYEGTGVVQLPVEKLSSVRSIRIEKMKMEKRDPQYWQLEDVLEDAKARIQTELSREIHKIVDICYPNVRFEFGS